MIQLSAPLFAHRRMAQCPPVSLKARQPQTMAPLLLLLLQLLLHKTRPHTLQQVCLFVRVFLCVRVSCVCMSVCIYERKQWLPFLDVSKPLFLSLFIALLDAPSHLQTPTKILINISCTFYSNLCLRLNTLPTLQTTTPLPMSL